MAKDSIPRSHWKRTPVVLKATAGLRLLPEEKAQALLLEVKEIFKQSPFLVPNDSVSIMDGSYEGGEVLLYVLGERVRVNLMKGTGNRDGVLKKTVLIKEKEISKEEWNSKKWKDGEKGHEIQRENNKDGAREERRKCSGM